MKKIFKKIDHWMVSEMLQWGIPLLRVTLGIVFIWFGLLKILDESPVKMLISDAYPFLPLQAFLLILGIWEVVIGIGLLTKRAPRITIGLLWLQMIGVFMGPLLLPHYFFQYSNPFFLTMYGEFVIKNIVFLSASLVIGGHIVKQMQAGAKS